MRSGRQQRFCGALRRSTATCTRGGWAAGRAHSDHGREITGKVLGILGMGSVGQALARIAVRGFGMPVLCHTRSGNAPEAGQSVSFADLLAQSDFLALCAPLTDQTRGIVDAAALARMRPGAILVNVARGPLVQEAALLAALASGPLGGAAIDVVDTQPRPPVPCPAECDPDPAYGRDHRGKHAAHGSGRGGGGAAGDCPRPAAQSCQPRGGGPLSAPFSGLALALAGKAGACHAARFPRSPATLPRRCLGPVAERPDCSGLESGRSGSRTLPSWNSPGQRARCGFSIHSIL